MDRPSILSLRVTSRPSNPGTRTLSTRKVEGGVGVGREGARQGLLSGGEDVDLIAHPAQRGGQRPEDLGFMLPEEHADHARRQ